MKNANVEIYVMLRGFDDVFSNYVQQRTSYTYDKIRAFVGFFFFPLRHEDHEVFISAK